MYLRNAAFSKRANKLLVKIQCKSKSCLPAAAEYTSRGLEESLVVVIELRRASSEDSDQPVHPPGLVRVLAVGMEVN